LGKAEGIVGFSLVREAAVGRQDAPKKIIDVLSGKEGSPEMAVSYVISLGDILQAQGNLLAARTTYEEAIRTMPQNGAILRKYANLLIETGRTSQAIAMLEAALKTDETQQRFTNVDLAYIYSALGEAFQGVGKLDIANDRFRIAKQLGRVAAKEGSLDKAQYASILNDSAGAAIRSRDLRGAQESLCAARANYQLSGSDERGCEVVGITPAPQNCRPPSSRRPSRRRW
jgi:tetratricopeptide (TPR) repeat protein